MLKYLCPLLIVNLRIPCYFSLGTSFCSKYIVYVIESAAGGVLFTSCLCQKPERASFERVRAFGTDNS